MTVPAAATLPESAVLVHIGPYKTGTTAIQFSLDRHRSDLLSHGVLYPGEGHRQSRPGYALMGRTPQGLRTAGPEEWDALVAEVRATTDRVCISSEDLASADRAAIGKLVADLGPDRVHVLVVVRRLDKILPSAWQERVKTWNETLAYDAWLADVLGDDRDTTEAGRRFWRNHGVAELLDRWTSALPPHQCVLLVAEEGDRTQQMRSFEGLLGLPEGLLTPGRHDNPSLSHDRVELLRRVNSVFADRGWPSDLRRRLIYRGFLQGLRRAADDPRERPIPPLPTWAARRVGELADARAAAVESSGARVLGDPDWLRHDPAPSDSEVGGPPHVGVDTAVVALEELLDAALKVDRQQARQQARQRARRPSPGPRGEARVATVESTPSRDLVRTVAGRARRRWSSRRPGSRR